MLITILFLASLAFLIFYLIGLFNKRIGRNMKVIIFHIRRMRASRRNMRKLRRQTRQAKRIVRRQKTRLLWRKLLKIYQDDLATKKSALK